MYFYKFFRGDLQQFLLKCEKGANRKMPGENLNVWTTQLNRLSKIISKPR